MPQLVRYGESLTIGMVGFIHHDVALISSYEENTRDHVFKSLLMYFCLQERRNPVQRDWSFENAYAVKQVTRGAFDFFVSHQELLSRSNTACLTSGVISTVLLAKENSSNVASASA